MTTLRVTLATPDGLNHVHFSQLAPKSWNVIPDTGIGLHAYSLPTTDGSTKLGIRLSNGTVRPDGTGFLGRLYYTSLTVEVDGHVIWTAGSGPHVFPPRGILERRFTIRDGVGGPAVTRGWSYPSMDFAGPFGPARELLPPVDRAHYVQLFASMNPQFANALVAGSKCTLYPFGHNGPAPTIDLQTTALGPFHPDGYPDPGAPAGYGIDASVGWEQCVEALVFADMAHECAMDRNPIACFDEATGEPIACTDWSSNYLAHPQLAKGEPAPQAMKSELPAFLVGTYDTFHHPNANAGSCPYQAALEAYQPDNAEHVIRAMRRACALVGWAQDPMAADDLRMLFEHHRTMSFGDRADDKTHSTDGSYVPASLSALSYYVALNPGHGAPVLRSFGWMMALGAWGNAPKSWSVRAIDTYLAMADRFGIPQREAHPPYIPPGYKGTQGFHSALIHLGAWTLSRAAGWREVDVLATIDRWRSYVLNGRQMPLQERPDGPGSYGPPKWIYTEQANVDLPGLTTVNTSGLGFQEHVLAVLGRAAQSCVDGVGAWNAQRFLTSGLGADLPAARIGAKLAQMRAHTGDQSQYAAYWAMLEKVST